MMCALSPLQQRMIALFLLLAVAAILWLGLVHPLIGMLAGPGEETERLLDLRSSYAQAAALRPTLQAQLQALTKQEANLPGLFPGANSAVAAAALQSEIKRLMEQNGGEIRSSQNRPASIDGNYEKIIVRFDVTVPMHSLEGLIYQLESHSPYLFIDQAELHAPETGAGGPAVVDPKLSIRWDIAAYRWAGPT